VVLGRKDGNIGTVLLFLVLAGLDDFDSHDDIGALLLFMLLALIGDWVC